MSFAVKHLRHNGIILRNIIVQWLELCKEWAHSMILWSDDPSGGRSCGV